MIFLISTNTLQTRLVHKPDWRKHINSCGARKKGYFCCNCIGMFIFIYEKKCDVSEPIIVLPCDQLVEQTYFDTIKRIGECITTSNADLVLMGIQPTNPSTKYGYIIPSAKDSDGSANVLHFKEKPDIETATKYLRQGALWNGGVFGFKLGYLIDVIKEIFIRYIVRLYI